MAYDAPPPGGYPPPPPGGYPPPPPGGYGGYGGAPGPMPENYLVWAILTTLFCCLPFGIVSIVYAAQVSGKYTSGDYAGAVASSENAEALGHLLGRQHRGGRHASASSFIIVAAIASSSVMTVSAQGVRPAAEAADGRPGAHAVGSLGRLPWLLPRPAPSRCSRSSTRTSRVTIPCARSGR